MTENELDKMDEILDLVKENNRILRAMHRRMFWGQVMTILYWLVILGVLGWSYVMLEPILSQYWNMFKTLTSTVEGIQTQGVEFPAEVKSLLEKVQ